MKFERIYLDLDRTLLDTDMFTTAVFSAVDSLYQIPSEQLHAEIPDYYIYHGQLRYYDFFAHMTALGLDPQQVEADVRAYLSGGDFLFPDAHDLVKFLADTDIEVSIVSFGPANYQEFKYSLLEPLHELPFATIMDDKADYLAAQEPKESLLVDDKLASPLPSWCTQFVIDRKLTKETEQQTHRLWRVNSLRSVESALRVGYNKPNQKGTSDEAH